MDTIKHYRDLKVWQRAMDLAEAIFKVTQTYPADQKYVLVSQMQRCALSIPSNIAEGRSRHSDKDFVYHLNVAKASAAELETQIILSCRLRYISELQQKDLLLQTLEVTKMIHGLKTSIKSPRHLSVQEMTFAKT